jgi:hypothetical protein
MTDKEPESAHHPADEPPGGSSGRIAADERPPTGSETPRQEDGPGPGGNGGRAAGRPRWRLVAVIVAGAAVLFTLSFLGTRLIFGRSKPATPAPARSATPAPEGQIPANFVTFRDEGAGIAISYPKSWTKYRTKSGDEQVKLVAGQRDSGDLLLLRVIPLDQAIPPGDVFSLKQSFDMLIGADKLNIIKQEQITLNGLVGWHYLYTFPDEENDQVGIKSHYLLANGAKIDVLVFQALPIDDFKRLGDLFDQIAGTFRSTPRPAPSPPAEPPPGG